MKTALPDNNLKEYIINTIIPRYDGFDKAHRRDHAEDVIRRSLELSSHYDVNTDMVYAAAAFHDLGLCEGREFHHLASGRIIREDRRLEEWFNEEQIETIAQAAEDHRASSKHEPRSIYGKILAEADRLIIPEKIIRRTIQFGLSHYPGLSEEGHWERTLEHLHEKYAEGGYLKLWIPESENAVRLGKLREIIRDEKRLKKVFRQFYGEECKGML